MSQKDGNRHSFDLGTYRSSNCSNRFVFSRQSDAGGRRSRSAICTIHSRPVTKREWITFRKHQERRQRCLVVVPLILYAPCAGLIGLENFEREKRKKKKKSDRTFRSTALAPDEFSLPVHSWPRNGFLFWAGRQTRYKD